MKIRNATFISNVLAWSLVAGSCKPDVSLESEMPLQTAAVEVTVAAFQYTNHSGTVSIDETMVSPHVRTEAGDHWLAYDVEIPVAGRYRVALYAYGEIGTTAWIEDYYDNPDQRTYNITGSIELGKAPHKSGDGQFGIYDKTGSPLNQGLHRMKLHLSGSVGIQRIVFSLIKSHIPTPVVMEQNMEGDEWELVWTDEFDGSGIPDTTKWTFDIGNWGWGNNELQYYTEARTENARQENGHLIIEARKNDMGNAWTSARLTTRGKVTFLYGRIEFSAMVPAEKGNWAAGWTLGDSYIDELSWPYCGEIDILESVGYQMDNTTGNGTAHASAHSGAYYFKLGNQPTGTIAVENMNGAFHTYAVNWTPQGITAYVDDVAYFHYNDRSTPLSWPFDKPQNIILNLTMGGGWGSLEGMDETVSSQKMIVDYVRVYQKKQ